MAWAQQCGILENKASDIFKRTLGLTRTTTLEFTGPILSLEFLPRLSGLNEWGYWYTQFTFPGLLFFFDGSAEKAHPFHFEMTFILQGCEVLS